jgi:hypothetical protein
MDIEGHLNRAREKERDDQLEAVRITAVMDESIGLVQRALADFRDALVRHDVPRLGLVVRNDEFIPESRRLFGFTPSYRRMTAKEVGACWRFYGVLIFDNGIIRNYPYLHAGIGTRIIPGPGDFAERAREALQAAGLGSALSSDHLYLKNGAEPTKVDWSTIRGQFSSYYQSVDFHINQTKFEVRGGDVMIRISDDPIIDVPFGQEAAEFIAAGGRLPRAIR